ncbi:MAG: O-antigen ligase family protein [Acidimicrobiales bacterium]
MINRRVVDSYAIFWLLGIAFLWWPFLLVVSLGDRRPVTRRPLAILITTAGLAVSLLLAAGGTASPSRLVGAFTNLTVWIILCRCLSRDANRAEGDGVVRGILDLALFQGILVVGARAVYPALSGVTLPLARLLPSSLAGDANVAAFSTVRLAIPDYYDRVVIRTSGIFGNPTWAGAFAAVGILILLFAPGSLSPWLRRPTVRAALVVLLGVTLYYSYARVDVVGLLVAAVAVVAVRAKRVIHPSLWMASAFIGTAALVAALPLLPLGTWFADLNSHREGSLVAREDIYAPTLRAVAHAPTPLLGAGTKERVEGLVASLGTHSTYLGLAYRGGLLAATAFVVLLVALGARSFNRDASLAFGLVCFLALFCITDDIDAGHLLPLLLLVIHHSTTSATALLPPPSAGARAPVPAGALGTSPPEPRVSEPA